jgi:negative regulator of flagellin synthesis FlgM
MQTRLAEELIMDINGLNNQAITSYRSRAERTEDAAAKAEKAREARAEGEGDTIRLSHEAKLRTSARSVAMQTDDMRQERVDALKAQIADGTYHIDNEKIAAKLLQEEADLFR